MERIAFICGIPQAVDVDAIQGAINDRAGREDKQAVFHFCRSKMEVGYAVACAEPGSHVLLQESFLPIDPYGAWELSALRDIREIQITVSLSKKHYGSSYLAVLYAAGILDAVYEEEATAACIAEHIFVRRGRKACRDYYGITIGEAMGTVQVMEQPVVKRYIHYIGTAGGQEEMIDRYEEITSQLDRIQRQYLALQLPPEFLAVLRDNGRMAGITAAVAKKERRRKSI